MNLAAALSGQDGLEGVRRLLWGRSARRLLRGELATLLDDGRGLGPCRLRRAKFKPARKLTAYYDVQLRDLDGAPREPRPVAVSWSPVADQRGGATQALAQLQADVARRGLSAPFRALEAERPAWGMRILVFPLDERFPQLGRLSDPSYLPELLPDASRVLSVTPIRYRPGQRHVLRYDVDAPSAFGTPSCVFAKLYEDEQGSRSHDVAMRIAAWLGSSRDGLAAARPLAYLAGERVVLYPRVVGRPLSELLRRGAPTGLHLRRAGSLLHALHAAPEALAEGLSYHDVRAEVRAIDRACEHVDTLLPATGGQIDAVLELAEEMYERLPQEPPTLTHGDFKADHLWAASGRLTLIDFDRCSMADPACDLGKLLADLHWWCPASDLERAQQHFLDGYGTAAPARVARARVYEAMLLVKIAARRVPVFDPDWSARTRALVARAEGLLTGRRSTTRPGAPEPRRAALGRAAIRQSSGRGSADPRS